MTAPAQIAAAEADRRAGGRWFDGYTKSVEVHEAAVTLDELDAEARYDDRADTEYVLFAGGLSVTGTLDLKSSIHSIYVVLGDLSASRVILGDAVLVVTGKLRAREWVLGPPSEGVFEIAKEQIESDADAVLAAIEAPTVALFDRRESAYVLRSKGERRQEDQLVPELREDGEVLHEPLRERLLSGAPLFVS